MRSGNQPVCHATAYFQEMRASALDIAATEIDGDAVMEACEIDKPFVRFQQGNRPDNGIGERNHDSGRSGAMTIWGHEPAGKSADVVFVRRIANMPESGGGCVAVFAAWA
ncbi:hypothetical protein [Burkholderia sp. Se-20378]|uniref:hypothetical protein n=1 Tax=Burkholderia sp. Se-20378 TaxID=2703899 RepID=UPI001F127E55|nr:hypothetical protein [Burkholderia sp. Se-20378]